MKKHMNSYKLVAPLQATQKAILMSKGNEI
jgi:hypothetical protein